MALLRDRIGQAIENAPLTLALRKPNGVAYRTTTLAAGEGGAAQADFALPDAASRGLWRLEASDADGKVIGKADAEVQDFVPQRLKVTARTQATLLKPGQTFTSATVMHFSVR